MKILRNEYLIDTDPEMNSRKVIEDQEGEKREIFIDTSWDKVQHAVKFGTIFKVPISFDEHYSHGHEVKEGDKVCFHQFVVQDSNIIEYNGKKYWRAHFQHVWAIIEENEIKPLDRWLFVKPIKDESNTTESGLVKSVFNEYVKNKGIVEASSVYAEGFGIKKGDLIHFMSDADYPIEINGDLYYRMRIDSVICIERDGALVPLRNRVIVKEDVIERPLHLPSVLTPQRYGTVIDAGSDFFDVKIGDYVCFVYGIGTNLSINGEDFCLLRRDHLLWKRDEKANEIGIIPIA